MRDWRFFNLEADWTEIRMKYTEERQITFSHCKLPLFHCPDLIIQPDDIATRIRIYEQVRLFRYKASRMKKTYTIPLLHLSGKG